MNSNNHASPWNQFISTLSLVSRLPIPSRWYQFDASRVDMYLPLVGIIPAVGLVGILQVYRVWALDPVLLSLVFITVYYLLFNLFHFDGLLDTADAFLGPAPKEKREDILKDPRVGVYGLWTGVLYLAIKLYLFQKIVARRFFPLSPWECFFFLMFPISSRTAGALLPALFRPARKEGLGALVQQSSLGRTLEGFLAAQGFTFGIVSLIGGIPTPTIPVFLYEGLCMVLPFAVSLWIGTLYQKNLGGYTGDALGASIEMTELLYLGFFLFFPTNQL